MQWQVLLGNFHAHTHFLLEPEISSEKAKRFCSRELFSQAC